MNPTDHDNHHALTPKDKPKTTYAKPVIKDILVTQRTEGKIFTDTHEWTGMPGDRWAPS